MPSKSGPLLARTSWAPGAAPRPCNPAQTGRWGDPPAYIVMVFVYLSREPLKGPRGPLKGSRGPLKGLLFLSLVARAEIARQAVKELRVATHHSASLPGLMPSLVPAAVCHPGSRTKEGRLSPPPKEAIRRKRTRRTRIAHSAQRRGRTEEQ